MPSWIRALLTLAFLPAAWRLPAFGLLGVAAGLGLVLVRVSELPSYLTEDPRACINCHIMLPEYTTWQHSSHAKAAVCNDCHVPHDSLARKYAFKARDGMRHATIFALRREPQVIEARTPSRQVIEANCRRCHTETVGQVPSLHDGGRSCTDCHDVPHGGVRGLGSTPNTPNPRWRPEPKQPARANEASMGGRVCEMMCH